jgi:hypothetical protein
MIDVMRPPAIAACEAPRLRFIQTAAWLRAARQAQDGAVEAGFGGSSVFAFSGGPSPRFVGRGSNYRENFLYLIRFGITESSPRRRILSFS